MFGWLQSLLGGGSQANASAFPQANSSAQLKSGSPNINASASSTYPLVGDSLMSGYGPITTVQSEGSKALGPNYVDPLESKAPAPSSGSGTQYPDNTNAINTQKSVLDQLGAREQAGLGSIASQVGGILGEYDTEKNNFQSDFDTNMGTNSSNMQRNIYAALLNASQGLRGLRGTLSAMGGLSGTNLDVMNRAVQSEANNDIAGANDAFTDSSSQLNQAMTAFTRDDEARRRELERQREAAEASLRNSILTDRQSILGRLSDLFSGMGNTDQGNAYAQQAQALSPQVATSSIPAGTPSYSAISSILPQLANYLGGASSTQVSVSPSVSGVSSPLLVANTRRREE